MKKLFYLLIFSITLLSCKKENNQPQNVLPDYTGKYISQSNGKSIWIVNINTTYYLDSLYKIDNSASPYRMKVDINGSYLTIPDKSQGAPNQNMYNKGNGNFDGDKLTLDWTTDRSDYDPAWHSSHHHIFIKQ